MAKKLQVEIIGNADSLQKAFRQAGVGASGFGSKLGTVAKYAGLAIGGAALGGVALTLKQGIGEWEESTRVSAQTAAVLKSTGGVANITAKQVDQLSTSLMRKSGVDDEAIKSGANMLLTFTNIRNEAGKGNDVFNQSTQTLLDMSVALGQDMPKSAIQLGKALNDPIKGITALRRVGVTFDDAQKKQIETLVKSGHTLEAQKLILHELNREFGGSAEAAGKTLPGQIDILKQSFNNLAGDIVAGLVPSLQSIVTWTNSHMPQIEAAVRQTFDEIKRAISTAVDVGRSLLGFYERHATAVQIAVGAIGGLVIAIEAVTAVTKLAAAAQLAFDVALAANPIGIAVVALGALAGALAVAYAKSETFRTIVQTAMEGTRAVVTRVISDIRSVFEGFASVARAVWQRFGGDIVAIARAELQTLRGVVQGALQIIEGVFRLFSDVLHGNWSKAWGDVREIARGALNIVVSLIRGAVSLALTAAKAIGKAIIDGIKSGLSSLASMLLNQLAKIPTALGAAAAAAGAAAVQIGKAIIGGVLNGVGGLFGALKSKLEGTLKGVLSKLNPFSPVEHGGEIYIGRPLAEGAIKGWLEGSADLPAKLSQRVREAVDRARRVIDSKRDVFAQAFSRVTDRIFTAFDAETQQHETPAERLIRQITDRREMEDLQKALDDAIAGGDPTAIMRAREDIQLVSLRKQAEDERQNYEARRANLREALSDRLATIQAHFTKEGGTVAELTKSLTGVLEAFGLDFKTVGEDLGNAFLSGLKGAIGKAGGKASAISKTIDDIAGSIKVGKVTGLASGGIVRARPGGTIVNVGEGGRDEAVIPLGRGTGGPSVTVNVYGDVSGQEIVEKVRSALIQLGGRNIDIFGGLA